jgi:hypothetical protein
LESFRFELAKPDDDPQLRYLLARNPMSGSLSLSFRREPSYFAACGLDGDLSQTIVCREVASQTIVGCGSRSIRDRYIQGKPEPIGYLGSLRLDQQYRRRGLVARGFRFFKKLDADTAEPLRPRFYVTTIADSNSVAEQTLVGGRAGLPYYHRIATWNTYSIAMRRCQSQPVAGIAVRSATENDRSKIVEFLNAIGSHENLFPRYSESDFDQAGTFRDLRLSQLWVAWDLEKIVGTFAFWDQSAFKQVVVEGYTAWLRSVRPFYNRWARWKGDPMLPNCGEQLEHLVGSLLVVRSDRADVARLLVAAASQNYCHSAGRLLLGFDSKSTLSSDFATLASHTYTTGVYLVSWDPGRWGDFDKDRSIYLELGCL